MEKVDITYTDFDGKNQSKTSDVTPKLKLPSHQKFYQMQVSQFL